MSYKQAIQTELEQLPLQVLTRYVEGKLSSEEAIEVETFVEENPLYADALEGLQQLPDPALAQAASHDIRFRTRHLLRKHTSRISQFTFTQYATAAVAVLVVLFAASAVLYFNALRPQQASPEAAQAAPPPAPLKDEGLPSVTPSFPDENTDNETWSSHEELDSPEEKPGEELAIAEEEVEILEEEDFSEPIVNAPLLADEDEMLSLSKPQSDSCHVGSVTLRMYWKETLTEAQKRAYQNALTPSEAESLLRKQEEQKYAMEKKRSEEQERASSKLMAEAEEISRQQDDTQEEAKTNLANKNDNPVKDSEVTPLDRNAEPSIAASTAGINNKNTQVEGESLLDAMEVTTMKPRNSRRDRKNKKEIASGHTSQPAGVVAPKPTAPPGPEDLKKLDEARSLYYASSFSEAEAILLPFHQTFPAQVEPAFLLGNLYSDTRKPARAVPMYEKVIRKGNSVYLEEARWKLANAYISVNRYGDSKKLLKLIIREKGAHALEAKELLKNFP